MTYLYVFSGLRPDKPPATPYISHRACLQWPYQRAGANPATSQPYDCFWRRHGMVSLRPDLCVQCQWESDGPNVPGNDVMTLGSSRRSKNPYVPLRALSYRAGSLAWFIWLEPALLASKSAKIRPKLRISEVSRFRGHCNATMLATSPHYRRNESEFVPLGSLLVQWR